MSKDVPQNEISPAKLTSRNGRNSPSGIPASKAAVQQAWAEVLRLDNIGDTDNFFDLGGDSLKAMEVISRLQGSLKIDLPLIVFFEDPTISHLTAAADELRANELRQVEGEAGPRSAARAAVEQAWREVLRRDNFGDHDNFFDLGGDSLKAMEVISRLQSMLNIELPLIAFFEDPTIAHLTAAAEELLPQADSPSSTTPSVRISDANKSATLSRAPLSFAQLMYWLLQQKDPLGHLYHQTRVVRIRGAIQVDVLQRALDEICRRQEVLRTRIEAGTDEPVQVVDARGRVQIQIQDLRQVANSNTEDGALDLALRESELPFDLATDLPLRVLLLRIGNGNDDHLLVVVMHHVVADGETGSIFFDELTAIYRDLVRENTPTLPELPFQYPEYAAWQREQIQGERLEKDIDYWRSNLEGAPERLNLPTDHPRPERPANDGARSGVTISLATLERLKALSQSTGSTLFTVMLSALRIVLNRWTSQSDIVIGTVASNRTRAGSDRVIGCFLNFLPLRNSVSPDETANAVLNREKQIVRDAFAHQDCPFLKIAAAAGSSRISETSPLYNVAFLLQNYSETKFTGDSFSAEFVDLKKESALLDLRFMATQQADGLQLDCEFRTELFNRRSAELLLDGFAEVLETLAAHPERRISDFTIPQQLTEQAKAAQRRDQKQTIAIASTFTAEPVEAPLGFWMKELGIRAEFVFAPYNQVFQQLLDPASPISRNADGANVILLRLSDWRRFEESAIEAGQTDAETKIERNLHELADALRIAAQRSTAPILVCVCPSEKQLTADPKWAGFLRRMEQTLISELGATPGLHVITSAQTLELYPVKNYEDEYADKLGHIPYTPEFFTAVASMLARRIFSLRSAPRKVIVVDCDNTLWKGVCGEEGPTGVSVDAPHRSLQELMLRQIDAGMLLCLASKNSAEDVEAVFAQNTGMLLRDSHIAARRVNWNAKSQNLREIANELQLGLDSFVFVDDNPLECAEVQAQCPEVLILALPKDAEQIPDFLRSVWALDHWKVTEEDAKRTAMYQQNAGREQARKQASTLDEFLASLELKIDIRPMQSSDLARVSQLTERTNQFNFTTIRRSEAEIVQFVECGGECLVVNLGDRFGDYGLVGVILFGCDDAKLTIDTMLLSCRALGRKVEHNMISRLGEIALQRRLDQLRARLVPTKKNQPAQDFLESIGGQFRQPATDGVLYEFPAEHAAHAHLLRVQADVPSDIRASRPQSSSANPQIEIQNRLLARIAADLNNVDSIARAVEAGQRVGRRENTVFVAPRTPLEEMIAGIWAQLLNVDRVGVHDNFFSLGGHSLLATQVVARVRQILGAELPLRAVFECPTVAEFAKRVEEARRSGGEVQAPPIVKSLRSGAAPMSFAQQRLWFLDQLEPGDPLYNIAQMFRMRGNLDQNALHRALNKLVERHDSLRTTFGLRDGQPVQVIAERMEMALPVTDLRNLSEPEAEVEVERLARAEAAKSFDLAAGPLVRAQLLRLGGKDHVLLFTMHHIVSDRWSMGLVSEELAAHYSAFVSGKQSPLSDLKIQYPDFAVWQRQWLQGEMLEQQIAYWKKNLARAPQVLELPADRPRPAIQSHRGSITNRLLPKSLVEKLGKLSQSQGATLFMTLLAAFQTLLSKYSGQDDIVVGSPIANRSYTELESLIGFFVNTLSFRGDLSGNPTFTELLTRTRETALGAYAHQDIPFEKLVEELQPERSLSHNPIFQVMFAHQNAPMQALELPGLRLERAPVHAGTALFDMLWFAIEGPDGLQLRVEYNTDLFDEITIVRALGHFEQLLDAIVANPSRRLADLPLLSENERQHLLVELNTTQTEFSQDLCVQQLFEQRVAESPNSVAVVYGNDSFTYAELNARANQLANYLRKSGVGPEVLVGLCVERSLDMMVGLLGILKAGGAYVPLDPLFPKDRIAFIVEDAKAPLLITQSALLDTLPQHSARTICLDADWSEIAKESSENLSSENMGPLAGPDNLAYVLFTSGSTGKPKGVPIEHHCLTNFLCSMQREPGISSNDVLLAVTTLSFDIAGLEMYLPLVSGARVVIASYEEARDGASILRLFETHRVTLMQATPVTWRLMIEAGWNSTDRLKILCGGEAFPRELADQLIPRCAELWNMYGPTETTIWSTLHQVREGETGAVSIGRPIANTDLYILDSNRQPVPMGVAGELYIGGDGLARGYLDRPELTAEKFVPHPFSSSPRKRLYRTGDLCRYRRDGSVVFLSRIDTQVKVRGFRIELGEIESVLAEHKGVAQAVVLAREDRPGNPQLVAYVIPEPDAPKSDQAPETLPEAIVNQWESIWDEAYKPSVATATRFNIAGWNSSYTGTPVPPEEMLEWLECTVERISSLQPKRILEIGCGTGLLLFRLLDRCEHYQGIDLSESALNSIRKQLTPEERQKVSLTRGAAHDLSFLQQQSFDTVIINSVAQYFPSIDYLLQVLQAAIEKTGEGGTIFVGDVRSLPLLRAFHAAVQLRQSPASLNSQQWLDRVQRQVSQEEELVIDPDFFRALQHHVNRAAGVDILLKRGRFHNEMNQFRYDVLLRVGREPRRTSAAQSLNWRKEALTVEALQQRLERQHTEALSIETVPNCRVAEAMAALDLAAAPDTPKNLDELQQAAHQAGMENCADPHSFWQLESTLGYSVALTWSDDPRCFDAVFRDRNSAAGSAARTVQQDFSKDWKTYANDPARGSAMRNLVPELRGWLNERLPEYMLPAAFVVLDSLPLTPNGKIDRKALPAPEFTGSESNLYIAPRNSTEQMVAEIWSEVLHVPRVGVNDDFFGLGGHSLLATQVISRIRQAFKIELPLRVMFEFPRLDALAERIQSAKQGLEVPTIVRVPRGKPLPAAFAQQRLWFLDQLEPDNPVYNIPYTLKATGPIDDDAIEQSLNIIAQRHESMRTSFAAEGDGPVQIIHESVRVPFKKIDLSTLDPDLREAEARRLIAQDANTPFNISQAPLVRAMLMHLSETEHYLLINIHHIISDRWSMGVLSVELTSLYEAIVEGRTATLPDLPLQYADYAVWQRAWLDGDVLEKQLTYWKTHLKDAPPVLEMPTDRPRPPVESSRGEVAYLSLPRELSDKLSQLSRQHGATLFMTLLAGFQALLSRYSGQQDIVLGTAIANRNQPELENVIGFFLNTLPLRTRLSGDPRFSEMIAGAKETALGAYAHQDMPFEKLVESLKPERSLSYSPLVQVYFILQNAPMEILRLKGLRLKPVPSGIKTVKGDMYLSMVETADGLDGRLEYSTDLFDGPTTERFLEHYRVLLEAVAGNASLKLSELPLLTTAERDKMLLEWNATSADYPRDLCLHELFELQAARSPDAVACIQPEGNIPNPDSESHSEDRQITYRELNQRANQLAHALRRRGVGPGQRIGLFLERSIEMMVGLIGIQKSGAAYVPLDPAYPAERIRLTLEDAAVPVVITQDSLVNKLPRRDEAILCLDRDASEIAKESTANPANMAGPEDLVYVIFTSGSTGRPKGVQVPHRAVVNLLTFMAKELRMGPADVFPALASFAFDMCIPELYLALISGGRVVIGRKDLSGNGEDLAATLRKTGATVVHATPTTWNLLLEAGFSGKGLKRVIGAEPLPRELCRRLLEADSSLYNFYGPTETTVWSTFHHFRSPQERVVVGKPLANTQVYILDAGLQPVPIGVPGEIYIGGDGVARGYLNRPELTAEKFVRDPFSAQANAKMYRTGDLGRYLDDGRIEFQARADHQVKIRGYRIELGEIEAVIGRHPSVDQGVVAVREDVVGDKRLVAYVVTKDGKDGKGIEPADLRTWVKDRLPDYMLPVAWVQMDKLPLSANGKVDRKQLPAPEYLRPELEGKYVDPRGPEEQVIAGVWASVLKIDRIGAHDDFFALGGHSLLATQVVSRIRQAFNIALPLRDLFEAPTVAKLAERVRAAANQQLGLQAPPIRRVPRNQPLPLSFPQQRLWFLDQLEPGNPIYNVAHVTRMRGPLNARAMEQALNEIVRRHESLRTTFHMLEDEPIQVISTTLKLELSVADASHMPDAESRMAEARRIAVAAMKIPFDLQTGPLIRPLLIKIDENDHALILNTHHIISDRWSLGVLSQELAVLYEANLQGGASPLPELELQYADYAVWQREFLSGDVLDKQIAYWRKQLEGAPPVLELPTDHPRKGNEQFWGAQHRQVIPGDLVNELKALSRNQRATLFMALLAGFQMLLGRMAGQNDVVVGTDLANRNQLETEKLIGFFVNLLPMRAQLKPESSFADFLQQTRESSLQAMAHQDIPFDKLVEELRPERSLTHNPLVQVLFVMQNTPQTVREFGGLKLGPLGVSSSSRFDLVLFVNDPEGTPTTMWVYNPNLFEAATIERMANAYELLLKKVCENTEISLASLSQFLDDSESQRRSSEQKKFQEAGLDKLRKVRRKAIEV